MPLPLFIDLCEVFYPSHSAAADQIGTTYTFEKHVSKLKCGKGFSAVWKRGRPTPSNRNF